jgi:probable HAF family extracellular repeat protein
MKTSLLRIPAVGLLAASFLCGQAPLANSQGTFTLIDYPNSTSTTVWGINSRKEMVGVYTSADRVSHGFLLSSGRYKTIDPPASVLTIANGINARGDIVGEYATSATGRHHGFLFSEGRFTTVDFPGSASTALVGVASNGDVVGLYDDSTRGFLLHGDTYTKIDLPGATATVVNGISPQGDIVGGYSIGSLGRAFLLQKGRFTTWDYPNAAGFTNAVSRNAAGDTVGRYRDAAGVSHGYVLSGGQFTSYDYPGASFTGGTGITPDGDIAGRCTVSGVSHGFLLTRGQQPRFQLTDLGTLGGDLSLAFGISNAGAISGAAAIASGEQHPFLWRDGKMMDLGGLGGNGAGTNPLGSLVVPIVSETPDIDPLGEDFCGYGTHHICLAGIWKEGKTTAFPTLGGNNAISFAMNEQGQMAGVAEKPVPDAKCPAPQKLRFAPVIWGPNATDIQELRLPAGDTVGFAYGINEKGEAVGSTGTCENVSVSVTGLLASPRAVLWEQGVPRDLGNLGGTGDTTAIGLNDRTEVVGASSVAGGSDLHGFIWSRDEGLEDIGAIGSDAAGLPSSINSSRQVVGASCDADFNCRAFLWERYSMTDLNDLVPANSPLYLVFATWINDVGQIVGYGVDKQSGELHGFLVSPAKAGAVTKSVSSIRMLPAAVRNRLQEQLRFAIPGSGVARHR